MTYGAEELERKYPLSAVVSFTVALLLTLSASLFPLLKEALRDKPTEAIPVKVKRVINYSELQAPPPIDLDKPKPEITQAQPIVKTVKFLPPKAEKDELVPDEEELPTMEELENTMIGVQGVDGLDSVTVESQDVDIASELPVEEIEEIFEFVELMPEFEGGMEAFNTYLKKNLRYPQMAKEAKIQGRVFVSFVIEKDGNISDVTVLRSVHQTLDAEAVRVISGMPPWIPGRQNQQTVRVRFTIPVNFVLK